MNQSRVDQGPIEPSYPTGRGRLTALVISYNRRRIIKTCLTALAFADEILVVDMSSTDGTAEIAASLADRVISVPSFPAVEDTRAFAIAQCRNEWILCLDGDECLSPAAIEFFHREMFAPRARVYMVPRRRYIMGRHDENAYYWPEYQPRLFHRDAVKTSPAARGGITINTDAIYKIPFETRICIHQLSSQDISEWIEKANRYTSSSNRRYEDGDGRDLIAFSHARIDAWVNQTHTKDCSSYPAAVALLRAFCDVIVRLKHWEIEEGLGGVDNFQKFCGNLDADYARLYSSSSGFTPRESRRPVLIVEAEGRPQRLEEYREVELNELRGRVRQLRRLLEANPVQAQQELDRAGEELQAFALPAASRFTQERITVEKIMAERLAAAMSRADQEEDKRRQLEDRLAKVLSSEFWRMTAPFRVSILTIRRLVEHNIEKLRTISDALRPANVEQRQILIKALRRELTVSVSLFARASKPAIRAALAHSDDIPLTSKLKASQNRAPHQAAVVSYPIWSLRFDTPSADAIRYLDETAPDLPDVVIVARFSSASAHLACRTAAALRAMIGIRWSSVFVTESPGDSSFAEAFQGDGRFSDLAPRTDLGGKIVVLLEAGAMPRCHGVRLMMERLVRNPDLVLVYADEDRLSPAGMPEAPWFKPEHSPLLAAQGLLFGRMLAIRPDRADVRLSAETVFDPQRSVLELALEVTRGLPSDRVGRVAHVVFHDVLPPVPVRPAPVPRLDMLPVVSVFIPTRDRWDLLGPCLRSLRSTEWPVDRLEIIVIDNGSTEAETLEGIDAAETSGEIRVIHDARKFNYAALNNVAARAARGDVFVLLNNDTEIIDPTWLRKLVAFAVEPGVGAVGAKLVYADRTVQHGGIILGVQGGAAHAHAFLNEAEGGYQQLANATHEVAAVTGACLAVSRVAFEEVGGLREEFEVATNDLVFCLDLLAGGRRNIYVADCVLIHHESKTRGFDTTPEQIAIARRATLRAWQHHAALLRNDPYYSPNLSLEFPYQLTFAPRRRPLWRNSHEKALKIMILSSTYARGHGVAVAIKQQVRALRGLGHDVILAGVTTDRDLSYGGTKVLEVHDPRSAATLAADLEIDVIVAHTTPFFGVARWTGAYPPVMAYDHGEPPPELYPDAPARREVLADKNACLRMCKRVVSISRATADESIVIPDDVIALGNNHLGTWSPALAKRRVAVRAARGWDSHAVVLNVTRFHAAERKCKGIDQYTEMLASVKSIDADFAARCVFVLCGMADADDVAAIQALGLTVISNVSDDEIIDLYAAADVYANFSRWAGYNLGVGQALAMGLPAIASDIPAHRAFGGVIVVHSPASAALSLFDRLHDTSERVPRIWDWDESLNHFSQEVERLGCLSNR